MENKKIIYAESLKKMLLDSEYECTGGAKMDGGDKND